MVDSVISKKSLHLFMNYAKALILIFLMATMSLAGCTGPSVAISDVDNDGVIDILDLCPNTPANTQVNSNGCEEKCPDFKVWDDMRDEHEYFGADVQTDGRSVIVGAPDDNDGGKAFVFWCKTPIDGWLLEDELVATSIVQDVGDNFGHSVSILGDYAIVGDPTHDIVSAGSTITDAGAAFVFKRNSNGIWSEIAMLQETSPNQGAHFGWSVDISANAMDRSGEYDVPIPGTQFNAVVGAPTSNAVTGYMTGAAYFFTTDSTGVEFADVIRLEASPQYHDGSMTPSYWGPIYQGPWDSGGYGSDVAIFGSTVVVGSPIEGIASAIQNAYTRENGAAYVFVDIATTQLVQNIQETLRLTMPDNEYCIGLYGTSNSGNTHSLCNNNDYFGHSVDIDSEIIVVGATGGPQTWSCWASIKDSNGAAYVFERESDSGLMWDETVYVKLEPSVDTEYSFNQDFTFNTHSFGWEVSADRDMIMVASKVRTSTLPNSFTFYGQLNVGPSDGSSYIFNRDAPLSWNEVAIIGIPDIIYPPNYNGLMFNIQGYTHNQVAIGGSYIIIGSQWDNVRPVNWLPGYSAPSSWASSWGTPPTHSPDPNQNGQNTGSAYICWFDEIQNVYCDWTEETNPGGTSYTWGSYSVANSNESADDDEIFNTQVECPYQDINICRIMGYLYSEEIASLYHDADPHEFSCSDHDDSNRTNKSFSDSYAWECFEVDNSSDDDENETEDTPGCTDPDANNYDEDAEVDDGSCTYKNDEETEKEEDEADS